ncbi:MAG TPA: hypothetical protein VGB94_08255 [Acidobacteriaceae bacterium]
MPYIENYLVPSPADDLVIWRYIDLPKLLIMLEQQNLYFALLEEFEDKWEAVISRDLSRGIQVSSGSASGTVIQNYLETFGCFGINCWYSGPSESIAMWRLYTTSIYGVAIKSTIGRLKLALKTAKESVVIGKVEYRDHTEAPSEVLAPGKVSPFTAVLQKRTCYSHECEIRAITVIDGNYEKDSISSADVCTPCPPHGVALLVDLSILIQSIITGPNFPRWANALLTSALSRAAISAGVVESNAFKAPEVRYLEP